MKNISEAENEARMLRGELYHAFRPELTAKRNRCHHACNRFNSVGNANRRKLVELWKEYEFTVFILPFGLPNVLSDYLPDHI